MSARNCTARASDARQCRELIRLPAIRADDFVTGFSSVFESVSDAQSLGGASPAWRHDPSHSRSADLDDAHGRPASA
jgi:hypothetical protein